MRMSDWSSDVCSSDLPGHVATVYPAVELSPIPEQSTLRQELGLAQDDIVVGCVAVMRAQKGHKELIDAMEPLIRERPDVHLLFVGGGSPVFEQVQAYVAEKSLGKRIHLLGDRKSTRQNSSHQCASRIPSSA